MFHYPAQFGPGGSDGDGEAGGDRFAPLPFTIEGDDLPYKVEVWDETGSAVERVIAIAADASISYAAYYAAARDNPGRDITITYKGQVLTRWHRRGH